VKHDVEWDVIIAGVGPGGATAAGLLAKAGLRVKVLEKEEFPRFHIGESLLPAAEIAHTLLGVEPDPSVFLYKRGAQFICETQGRKQAFDFGEALPGPQRYAWHVERATFDTLLRDRARALGAEVVHNVRVTDIHRHEHGVEVITSSTAGVKTESAKFFIDATGQGRLLASRMRSVRPFRRLGKAAVFTHFSELHDSAWKEIGPGNDIRVVMLPEGWAWVIPLSGNRLSVGVVTKKPGLSQNDLESFLMTSPLLGRLSKGAKRERTRMVGNFSFKNSQPYGARYACIGDAACFIDPVFSSGVSLAMHSAAGVTRALIPAFAEGRESDPDLLTDMGRELEGGYDTFAAMVYRFYNTRFVNNMIFGAPAESALRPGIVSVLAGDVFRDDNPFRKMLLTSRAQGFHETKVDNYIEESFAG